MRVIWLIGLLLAAVVIEARTVLPGQTHPIDWSQIASEVGGFTVDALDKFAEAITNFEGKPGDLNYRNNNPGNLRYAGQPGAVGKDSRGFAIFDSWQSGLAALKAQIALDARRTPYWTISDFVNSYAPPSDNNPNNGAYAVSIAGALGVTVNTTLGSLGLA